VGVSNLGVTRKCVCSVCGVCVVAHYVGCVGYMVRQEPV
jgi:hypothetical protein